MSNEGKEVLKQVDTWLHTGVKQFKADIDPDDTTHTCVDDSLKLAMGPLLLQLNMNNKTVCKRYSLLNSLRNSGVSSAAFLALRI